MGVGVGLEYVMLVCAVLLCSLLGVALFRIGEVQIVCVEPQTDKTEFTESAVRPAGRPVFWIAGMVVTNIVLTIFSAAFYRAEPLDIIRTVLLCTVLWNCAWTDKQAFLIPNRLLLAGIAGFALIFAVQLLLVPDNIVFYALRSAITAVIFMAAGLLCRLISPGSVGMGDIKLFGVMGLYLGGGQIWGAIFFSLLAAFAYSLVLLITKRADRKTVIPFAPFLLIGTILATILTGI